MGRPLPPDQATTVVWPHETTSADRSSPEATAHSFVDHVLGTAAVETTADPAAEPDSPTFVDVDLGPSRTRVLTAPTADGWIVLQVGDAGFAVSIDPPRAELPTVPGAERVEVLVTTDSGAMATVHEALDVATGLDLPAGTVRSIATVHRDEAGAVLALEAGSF